jgi:hypothetical protein
MKDLDLKIKETYQLPHRIKKEITGRAGGKEIELAWAARPESFWFWEKGTEVKVFEKPTDIEGQYRPFMLLEQLARHEVFEWEVTDSLPDKRPGAIAVRAKANGHETIYYFDEKTGLLAGNKARQFIRLLGKEAWIESRTGNYEDFDGLKLYRTVLGYQDGVKTSELNIIDVRFFEKLDDQIFAVPKH